MTGSDDMSASVASSDARSSPPDSSAANSALQVEFYVIGSAAPSARLRLACRLAEQAYLSDRTALLWLSDSQEQQTLDELLWTFLDGSFVPHEVLTEATRALPATAASAATAESAAPVMLSAGIAPAHGFDLLINLAPQMPPCLGKACRVAEIVDGDESRRRAARARFKAYRELGLQPATHNVRDDPQPLR
jgi:DNA polymerase-3 subunit chi